MFGKNIQANSLKVFIDIQVPILLDCNLSCNLTNSKTFFSKWEIQLKSSDSDTRKSFDVFDPDPDSEYSSHQ